MMKDAFCGVIIKELIGSRPKIYSYLKDNGKAI